MVSSLATSLAHVPFFANDSETAQFRPACMAPPLVVVTHQHEHAPKPDIIHVTDPACYRFLRELFEGAAAGKHRAVGHNQAFDSAVYCARFPDLIETVVAAYDADGVTDTMIRQWLFDNAAGRFRGYTDERGLYRPYLYDLKFTAKRNCQMDLTKDAWRTSYGLFLDYPLEQWPTRAREVQQMYRERLPEREALLARLSKTPKAKQPKGTQKAITSLKDEIEGLKDAIAGSAERAREYPLEDATATLRVAQAQEKHAAYLKDQYRQSRAYFALYLQSVRGMRTDGEGVAKLKVALTEDLAELTDDLIEEKLVRENGVQDLIACRDRMIAVCKENGLRVIRTDAHVKPKNGEPCPSACSCGAIGRCKEMGRKAGHSDIYEDFDHPEFCKEHVGLDKDACELVSEFDPTFAILAEYKTTKKNLTNDVVLLEGGAVYPVHPRHGFAQTGRGTCSKPNIQNQSKREGIREAFVARPLTAFIDCDYPQLELYTLAQCCVSWFGFSKLAEVLLSGKDPHVMMAAVILKREYDVAYAAYKNHEDSLHALVKKVRQQAKPINFGRPGGMGGDTLVKTTRKQMGRKEFAKLDLDVKRAKELCKYYEETWPEMGPYFKRVEQLINASPTKRASVETLFTERTRGNCTYCATANNGFQALGADCAKNACWVVAREAYARPGSALYGTRPVAFVHDQIIAETPYEPDARGIDERAHHAANGLAQAMVTGANQFLPGVPIAIERMEPVMMLRWFKSATSLYVDSSGAFSSKPGPGRWLVPAKVVYGDEDKGHDNPITVFDDARLRLEVAA